MKKPSEVLVCTTFAARLRGLFSRRARERGYIVLVPCGAVHTFGMEGPIDVAFADRDGTVMHAARNVPKGRTLKCKGACAVAERMACEGAWFEQGDLLFAAPSEANERRAR